MRRIDGRKPDQLRPLKFETGYVVYPEGSVLVSAGSTRVLCNVTIDENVPQWMKAQKKSGGWVTGEYAMLPRSTQSRTGRETNGLHGRTHEIKRLIGRALRAAVDLEKLGPRSCIVDCDVLQADGGTRTAAISGGYLALWIALQRLIRAGKAPAGCLRTQVAAVSAGIVDGRPMVDLCYEEDCRAESDFNVVMDSSGKLIEVQGTAEHAAFTRDGLGIILDYSAKGIRRILALQKAAAAKATL